MPPMTAELLLHDLISALVAVAMFGAFGWSAWIAGVAATARRSEADRSGDGLEGADPVPPSPGDLSARWSAAFVSLAWGLSAIFFALVSTGAFQREVALVAALVLAAVLHRSLDGRAARRRLAEDLESIGRFASDSIRSARRRAGEITQDDRFSRLDLGLFAFAALIVFIRLARGLTAPPMAWDALTYHLLRAGRWVQTGGWATEFAPDAWGYYEFHPIAGDAMWAWAMLPFHSDCLVGLAGGACWAGMGLGAHALARALGAGRHASARWAAVAACVPAALNYMTTAYVDVFSTAMFLTGMTHLARAVGTGVVDAEGRLPVPRPREAILSAAALATGAAAKPTLLPALAFGSVVLIVAAAARCMRGRRSAAGAATPAPRTGISLANLIAAFAVAGVVVLPGMARAWILRGSPFYPFDVPIPGFDGWRGNPQMTQLYSMRLFARGRLPSFDVQLRELLLHWMLPRFWFVRMEHLNFGPAGPVVALTGLLGAAAAARSGTARMAPDRFASALRIAFGLAFAASVAAPVAGILSSGLTAQRTLWAGMSGRFILSSYAGLCALAALFPRNSNSLLARISLASGLAMCVPLGISRAAAPALAPVCVALLVLFASGWPALVGFARGTRRRTFVPWLLLAVASLMALPSMRDGLRHEFWRMGCTTNSTYDSHRLDREFLGAWPVWRALDGEHPRTIAAAAGWARYGHSWFRYPLLGARLQNTVAYISPFKGKEVLDYLLHPAPDATMDFETWHARLLASGAEVFVAMDPPPPEATWIRERPDLFQPITRAKFGSTTAYRIVRPEPPRAPE